MARLEIPALYRLEIGNSRWAWHKMDDLRTVVGLLFERSLDGLPESLLEGAKSDGLPTARALLREYGQLNTEALFAWSDEQDIDFVPVEEVPFDRPNLFVPAKWSLRVIEVVKKIVSQPKLSDVELFELTKHCLTERGLAVMELRLGIRDGTRWSHRRIAKKFGANSGVIRQIEYIAMREMRHEKLFSTQPAR